MFKKIWVTVLELLGWIEPFIQKWIIPAISLVDEIKNFILGANFTGTTPFDELMTKFKAQLTTFFNGDEAKVEDFINKLISGASSLNLGLACFSLPTTAEQIACFLKWLQSQPATIQDALYNKIAGAIAQANGATGTQSHIDALVQVAYSEKKETAKAV